MSADRRNAHAFTPLERMQALRVGADVLRERQPVCYAECLIDQGPNQLMAHAKWSWPGVVTVTLKYTGELVAKSLPGHPYELDHGAVR